MVYEDKKEITYTVNVQIEKRVVTTSPGKNSTYDEPKSILNQTELYAVTVKNSDLTKVKELATAHIALVEDN